MSHVVVRGKAENKVSQMPILLFVFVFVLFPSVSDLDLDGESL